MEKKKMGNLPEEPLEQVHHHQQQPLYDLENFNNIQPRNR